MQSAANIADGQYGLRDGSKKGDWRLPTKNEWVAMMDNKYKDPALSNAAETGQWKEGDAFTGVYNRSYWSSTTYRIYKHNMAWHAYIDYGEVNYNGQTTTRYVWAVRGGH